MCESEPETAPPFWGRKFDRSKAFQFCSGVEQGNCGVTQKINMKPWGSASDSVLSCVKTPHSRPCLPDPD